ncbi:acid phosphatase [Neoasaia chiangmaiensis NBRC 101099]|nr:HAD family acid phosphatase [Neoasaia chiangmaiensis]GBR37722.1 acid phosphatase [Neoasaia chiangmaiensis NBRC 101099]GEN15087.1 acid phosphatase [Neoasaia chiangmaiensis]
MMLRHCLRGATFALALAAIPCAFAQTVGSEPPNVGEAAHAARIYHDSGRYAHDLDTVLSQADAWITQRAPNVRKPAVVLDIDETSISNWPEIQADDFGYVPNGPCEHLPNGPCGWLAWEATLRAAAIPGTLTLVRNAQAHGVAVFFVTARHESERSVTENNLRAAGYANWSGLVLRPEGQHTPGAGSYKSGARAAIEAQGYAIVANIGDQPSDLAGGHAERGFLLPNPFYRVP